jgi:MFS family permease
MSFHVPDFRRLWTYNVLSSLGMSMEMLAQGWLVLEITDSPFWVGAVPALRGTGQLLFGPLGGVVADRFDRRRALQVSQTIRAVTLLAMGLLIAFDRIELWHCLAVALIEGMVHAVVLPSNGTLMFDIVGRQRLLNAVATQHAAFNIAKLVGSVLAGLLMSKVGIDVAYFVIAAAFGSSPIPLFFIKTRYPSHRSQQSMLANLKAGLEYAGSHKVIRRVLAFSVFIEGFGFGYQIMLPVIARDYLEVGATGLGFLSAAGSVGALVGTTFLASVGDIRAKGILLLIFGAALGISLVGFGLSQWYATSLLLSGLIQACLVTYDSTLNTSLQLMAVDEMRGRILGLVGFTYGFTPMGGFIYGVVASISIFGAPYALAMGGGMILAGWAWVLLPTKALRRPFETPSQETIRRA